MEKMLRYASRIPPIVSRFGGKIKQKNIHNITFVLFYCFLLSIPISYLFYSGFYNLLNPDIASNKWIEGNDSSLETKLNIQIVIKSINIDNNSFELIYYIQKRDVINETIIENDAFEEYIVNLHSNDRRFLSFNNFSSNRSDSYSSGEVSFYPFDNYGFSFKLSPIDELNITNYGQINVLCRCLDPTWEFSKLDAGILISDDERYFKIIFIIKRKIDDIIFKSLIPLIILGGISYLGLISTNPLQDPSKDSYCKKFICDESALNDNYNDYKEAISFDRKFRIDSSKWILAFSIANLYITTSLYSISTLLDYFSLITIAICFIFFATSKYQGKTNGAVLNIGISLFSLVLIIIYFLPLF